MQPAVGKGSRALQVSDRFGAVVRDVKRAAPIDFFHGAFEKEDIVFVVFNQKRHWIFHEADGDWSWIQKRLLWPGADSTPTFPPIRSTAFLTTARPMPVPS